MSLAERIARYRQLAGEQGNAAIKYKNQLNANSLFRLLLFLTGSLFCYFLYPATVPVLVVAAATTIGFLALLKRHGELQQRMARSEVLAKIAKNELRAFEHDFTPFDGAAEHVDPSHPFSFDLDIFGEGSLFQMLNRTSLEMGKGELASMLKMPLREGGEIRKRQGAVRELSEKEDFCLDFRTIGMLSEGQQLESHYPYCPPPLPADHRTGIGRSNGGTGNHPPLFHHIVDFGDSHEECEADRPAVR